MTNQAPNPNDQKTFLDVFKFCPKCGGTMEPRGQYDSVMPTCVSSKCGYIFWQNSHPCVVAIIQNEDGLVLMTERGIEPDKGKLDLPGGFMHRGEHPVDAVGRETREEIGIEVEIMDFVGFETDHYYYQGLWEMTLIAGFTARIIDGEPHPADQTEITRVVWVDPNNFKPDELAFANNERFLQRVSETKLT